MRVWRGIVRIYRDIEGTLWGRLLLDNLWPAYIFALPLAAKIWSLSQQLADGSLDRGADLVRGRAVLAQEVATVLFLFLVVVLFAVRRPVLGRRTNLTGGLVALAGTFLLNVVAFLPLPSETPTSALFASTVIVAGGTLFSAWSLLTLGRCFGLFPEARGLVQRGPYRWIRHPVYAGELFSALGLLVAKPHVITLALYLAFAGFQYWRAILEEAALEQAFPAEYPGYRSRTGRLVPRWR